MWDVEGPTVSRQSAQPYAPAVLYPPRKYIRVYLKLRYSGILHRKLLYIYVPAQMRMPPATAQKIIRPTACRRSIHELGICQFVTWNRDVQNDIEMVCFIRTLYASRQVAPPSAFPHTRCNLRGTDITLLLYALYIYMFVLHTHGLTVHCCWLPPTVSLA
jgi:hypothetical protein